MRRLAGKTRPAGMLHAMFVSTSSRQLPIKLIMVLLSTVLCLVFVSFTREQPLGTTTSSFFSRRIRRAGWFGGRRGEACGSGTLSRGSNVAVFMYGQARTLNVTHCSITRNVLAPLLAEEHKVQIFVCGEDDKDSWQYREFLKAAADMGIGHTLSLAPRPKAPPACVTALHERYEQRMSKLVKPGEVYAAERLSHLSYRESANNLRIRYERVKGMRFDTAILIRPDVEYASNLPPVCGGESENFTVHSPAWSTFGGINDRFLVSGAGRAFDHYMSLYSGLCRDDMVTKLPKRWFGKGLNSERIYSWWMKHGGYTDGKGFKVSTRMLRDFVFYRTR